MAGVVVRHSSSSRYLLVLALGCSSLTSGTARPLPSNLTTMTASGRWVHVTTSEPEGLVILANALTSGSPDREQGWLANDQTELTELWHSTKSPGQVPVIDFQRYIVMGLAHYGWPCRREIRRAVVSEHGTILLQGGQEQITCNDVRVPLALVIALPRWLLHDRALLIAPDVHHAFEFSIPAAVAATPTSAPTKTAEPRADETMELVPLPPAGHLRLVTLRDHNQVWVSHEADGTIGVFGAETSLARWPSERSFTHLSVVVTWYPAWGRFVGGWDTQGRSVHGFPPLTPRRWRLSDRGELTVGGPTEPRPAPIRPPASAPQLDGPENAWSAYASLPSTPWQSLSDGEVGLVDLDVVASPAHEAQLCRAPRRSETPEEFNGCPRNAPHVWGEASPYVPTAVVLIEGPLVVRRHGALAEVIVSQTPIPKFLRRP